MRWIVGTARPGIEATAGISTTWPGRRSRSPARRAGAAPAGAAAPPPPTPPRRRTATAPRRGARRIGGARRGRRRRRRVRLAPSHGARVVILDYFAVDDEHHACAVADVARVTRQTSACRERAIGVGPVRAPRVAREIRRAPIDARSRSTPRRRARLRCAPPLNNPRLQSHHRPQPRGVISPYPSFHLRPRVRLLRVRAAVRPGTTAPPIAA